MSSSQLTAQAELFFRAYAHTVLPLHASLVSALCDAPAVPIELATVLEDIGCAYIKLSEDLNRELIRRNEMGREPAAGQASEHRIDGFVNALIARAGRIEFHDGSVVDGRRALESFPVVADAIRTALLIEKTGR